MSRLARRKACVLRIQTLVLLVFLAAQCVPSVAAVSSTPVHLGTWESSVRFYLGAKEPTTGPYLTLGPSGDSASEYVVSNVDAAPTALQNQVRGVRTAGAAFRLAGPLIQDYWLNLSKPIVGTLYVQTTTLESRAADHLTVWLEVWAGSRFVGGDQSLVWKAVPAPGFLAIHLKFRPEAAFLPRGEPFEIRVGRVGGLTDLSVGTSGAAASYVEFRYFDENPMSGNFFLENGRLTPIVATPEHTPTDAERSLGAALGLGLAGVTLAAGSTRRAGRASAAIALLLLAGLAGCAGSPAPPLSTLEPTPEGETGSTAKVESQEDAGLRDQGVAAIQGVVLDGSRAGIPLPSANVSLQGVAAQALSDAKGRYAFEGLSGGRFVVRAAKDGFVAANQSVDVRPGHRFWVNFTLTTPQIVRNSDYKPHDHDAFGASNSLEIVRDYSFDLRNHGGGLVTTHFSFCSCQTTIPLPVDARIPAGTGVVEVEFDWNTAGSVQELGLRVTTKTNLSADQLFYPRAPRTPYRVAIFPSEADSGHARWTEWTFHALILPPNGNQYVGSVAALVGKVGLRITAHKSVVPYEPAHGIFWNGSAELPVVKRATANVAWHLGGCTTPGCVRIFPDAGVLVPPGTKDIRGRVTFTHAYGVPMEGRWAVHYRSADMHPTETGYKAATMTWSAGAGDFVIPLKASEADEFYLSRSRWVFAPAYEGPEVHVGSTSAFWDLTLTATAHRAPGFTEGNE